MIEGKYGCNIFMEEIVFYLKKPGKQIRRKICISLLIVLALTAYAEGEDPAGADVKPLTRAEGVMKAFAQAYPDRIGPAELRDGDWAVPINGTYFFYAEGRLLPEHLRAHVAEYDAMSIYTYPADLPAWKTPDPKTSAKIETSSNRQRAYQPKRCPDFFDELWGAHTRQESLDRLKTIQFLGKKVPVHSWIVDKLALVEKEINAAAQKSPEVRLWINNIGSITAWNWRTIAETQSRSFHAYASAVDILPNAKNVDNTYWMWAARKTPKWWTVPYEKRFHPPDVVVKAFESYGFVWGGKWQFFDTMHFEYRPEILLLNKIPVNGLNSA
jgi:hypothetical protein